MRHLESTLTALKFMDATGVSLTHKNILSETGTTSASHLARVLDALERRGSIKRQRGIITDIKD